MSRRTPRPRLETAPGVVAALAAFAVVVAAASLIRFPYLWGLASPGEYPLWGLGAWIVFAALAAPGRADDRLVRLLGAPRERSLVPIVIAAAPAFCWWTRVQLPWLGDQLLWLRQISVKTGFLHQIEPLPYAFAEASRVLLPRDAGGLVRGPTLGFAVLAAVWVVLCLLLAREIAGPDPARRRWVWFFLVAAPQGLLFHGYVESYGVLLLALTAVAWLGCRSLRTGTAGWLWPVLLAAVGSHFQALGALPAAWSTARSRGRAAWAAAGTVVILGAAAAWYVIAGREYTQQKKALDETLAFLFPAGRLYDPFLGAHHLLGVANILLLAGGPALWSAPFLPWRRLWNDDRSRLVFLFLLALPGVAGVLFIRLSLGALRDWDLFSAYLFVFLPLFAWGWLARRPQGLPRYSALLLVLAVGHGLAWTLVDTDRDRAFDRAARLYGDARLFSPDARGLTGDELAYLERLANHTEGAAAWYARAAEANPTNWRFFNNQAAMLMSLGRGAEAIAPLRTAVAHGPTMAEPYSSLGSLLVNRGEPQEALEAAQRGLEKAGPNAHLFFVRGVAQAQLKQFEAAGASVDSALALEPENEEYLRHAAQIGVDSADGARALRHLETLVRVNPKKADYWRLLGHWAQAVGDTARAQEALTRFRELGGK